MPFEVNSLDEYIMRYQQDGVMWKAHQLLDNVDNPIVRNDRIVEIAGTLALIDKPVAREDYGKRIGKQFNVSWPTLRKMVEDQMTILSKKNQLKTTVHKNRVQKLEGDPSKWRFFSEIKNENTGKVTIEIDLEKFIALLTSFGFTRYEVLETIDNNKDESFQFVQLTDNIIQSVNRQQIIDFIENFVRKKYDFEGFDHVDCNMLLNKFYKNMRSLFNKDLFARVRTSVPIVVNGDTVDATFFYYRNGFVKVTKDGWILTPYSELNGSVWNTQMLDRDFIASPDADLNNPVMMGNFADFCWKVSGQIEQRFNSLCSIIGYLLHDFYDYRLKAILFTDSSLSDSSEGRTGKTLLAKMIGSIRSYAEINGKDFDASNKHKYEDAKLGTQLMHLNDVQSRGKFKFEFEDVFNDVTEGFIVNAKYQTPFRQFAKMIISANKTLNIVGASARDRIVEFELSQFFSDSNSPSDHYKEWFGRDWDDKAWQQFDNFMCLCSMAFHTTGLVKPESINLAKRKLINHTAPEFLDFMSDCQEAVEATGKPFDQYKPKDDKICRLFLEFPFDVKQMFDQFLVKNQDFKAWLMQRKFNDWLQQFSTYQVGVKNPRKWRTHSITYLMFQDAEIGLPPNP
jgi:hypothetical protein